LREDFPHKMEIDIYYGLSMKQTALGPSKNIMMRSWLISSRR